MRVRTFLAIARRSRIQRWGVPAAAFASAVALSVAPAHGAFSGANGKIFFTAFEPGESASDIFSVNPDGSELIKLTDGANGGPINGAAPFVSADGRRMVFRSTFEPAPNIRVMNTDGSGHAAITDDSIYDAEPAISPDGSRLAFISERGGGS